MFAHLVHQFPAFFHSFLVDGPGLVMGVEVVMVWLEGILHHSDDPPTFLQVPCHVPTRLGTEGQRDEAGRPRVTKTNPPPVVSSTGRW